MKTIVEIHLLCKELTQAIKKLSNAKGKQARKSTLLAEAVESAMARDFLPKEILSNGAWSFGRIPAQDIISAANYLIGLGVSFSPRALTGLRLLENQIDGEAYVKFLNHTYKVLDGEWCGKDFSKPKRIAKLKAENVRKNESHGTIPYAKDDPFYKSRAWLTLRFQALARDGRKCACCGITPEQGAIMNVDHIKPRRKYPHLSLEPDNLQVLCASCNAGKGNWSETDFRKPACASGMNAR